MMISIDLQEARKRGGNAIKRATRKLHSGQSFDDTTKQLADTNELEHELIALGALVAWEVAAELERETLCKMACQEEG